MTILQATTGLFESYLNAHIYAPNSIKLKKGYKHGVEKNGK